jgi:hypothetical protein
MGLPVLDATAQDLIELREAEERAFAESVGASAARARKYLVEQQAKRLRDRGNPPGTPEGDPVINTLRVCGPVDSESTILKGNTQKPKPEKVADKALLAYAKEKSS